MAQNDVTKAPNPSAETIARLTRDNRIRLNYTQQELSDKAGISLRSLQRIEKAQVIPRAYTLNQLSRYLEIELRPHSNEAAPLAVTDRALPSRWLLSIGSGIVLLSSTLAFVFQSPSFPETAFEVSLLISGLTALYTTVLFFIWRK